MIMYKKCEIQKQNADNEPDFGDCKLQRCYKDRDNVQSISLLRKYCGGLSFYRILYYSGQW